MRVAVIGSRGFKLTEYLPEYERYGRAAPIKRNDKIIQSAEMVLAFWDGKSRGTAYVISKCKKLGIPCEVHIKNPELL